MKADAIVSSEVLQGIDSALLERFSSALVGEPRAESVTHHTVGDVTKYVEIRLREATEKYHGAKLLGESSYGKGLAEAVRASGLAVDERGNDDPLYFLMRWFFDQRNPPHHADRAYPPHEVVEILLVGNELLQRVEMNMKLPRPLTFYIGAKPNPCPVGTPLQLNATASLPPSDVQGARVEFLVELSKPNLVKRFAADATGPNSWSVTIPTGALPVTGASVSIVMNGETFSFRSRRPCDVQLTE